VRIEYFQMERQLYRSRFLPQRQTIPCPFREQTRVAAEKVELASELGRAEPLELSVLATRQGELLAASFC